MLTKTAQVDIGDLAQLSRLVLPPMLSAAAYQKFTEYLARRAAVDECCRAFQVQDKEELQVCVWRCGRERFDGLGIWP